MSLLPTPRYADRIEKTTQVVFGGLRHHVNCADGELFDMENMSCADYPVLSTREYRAALDILQGVRANPLRLYAVNGDFLVLDTNGNLWYPHLQSGPVAHLEVPVGNVRFVRFGTRAVILPQK